MRYTLSLLLFVSGCNLFSAAQDTPDQGDTPDLDEIADLGDDFGVTDLGRTEDIGGPDFGGPDGEVEPDLALEGWWDEAWQHRVRVALDFGDIGEAVGVPVPVAVPEELVPLTDTDGTDLRVVNSNDVPLPFEVARWGEEPIIWVLVDVDPEDPDPHLWIYAGNTGAASVQNPATVWAGFDVAFHFDAAELGLNSADPGWVVQQGGSPSATSGLVGTALDAGAGSLRFPSMANTRPLDLGLDEKATFSLCFSTTTSAESQTMLWKEGGCTGWSARLFSDGRAAKALRHSDDSCNGWMGDEVVSPGPVDDGLWHCLTARLDRGGGTIDLALDGEHVASSSLDNTRVAEGGQFRIGNNYNDTLPMLGLIDEVWIVGDRRSDAWVEASHAVLLGDVVTIGDLESLP